MYLRSGTVTGKKYCTWCGDQFIATTMKRFRTIQRVAKRNGKLRTIKGDAWFVCPQDAKEMESLGGAGCQKCEQPVRNDLAFLNICGHIFHEECKPIGMFCSACRFRLYGVNCRDFDYYHRYYKYLKLTDKNGKGDNPTSTACPGAPSCGTPSLCNEGQMHGA